MPAGREPTHGPRAHNPRRQPYVVAHRGASSDAPENTLAAIDLAAAQGADVVEVDARLTADGALVVVHDATLSRTTDCATALPGLAPWEVAGLTAADVAKVTAGSHDDVPQRVPTLAEVIDRTRALGTGLLVELKPESDDGALERAVAAALCAPDDAAWLRERVLLGSFDVTSLARCASTIGAGAPPLACIIGSLIAEDDIVLTVEPATAGLVEPGMHLAQVRDGLVARGIGHLGVALLARSGEPVHDIDAALVAWLSKGGLELNVFADETEAMIAALDARVTSVLINHPGRLVALRDAPAARSR